MRQSDYATGILDIQAAEAASVYAYGPRPGQQQASIFAASMRRQNIQIEIMAIFQELNSLMPDKDIPVFSLFRISLGLHIKHIPLIVGLDYPIIHH